MKNLKNFLSFRNLDFTAIQILLSIIAISLAGMAVDASATIAKLDFHKSAISSVASELKTCPISYTEESCERSTPRVNSCELGSTDIFQTLKLSPLLKTNDRPLCSSPDRGQRSDSFAWQNS